MLGAIRRNWNSDAKLINNLNKPSAWPKKLQK